MDRFSWGLLSLYLLFPLSSSPQSLHSRPNWPTDEEFVTVNQTIEAACKRTQGVDEELVWALVWEESKYDPLAVGLKGEVGLGQLMPATARSLGVHDRTDMNESVGASVRHLAYLSAKYKNNVQLVLAAYNAGEPVVDHCRCVPAGSRAYVERIVQNRVFAKLIVQYVRESVLSAAAEAAKVGALETKLKSLELQSQNVSLSQRVDWERELARTNSDLETARAASERLRKERDRLRDQLQQDNSLGAQALVVTQSLQKRLEAVESKVASGGKDSQSEADANSELVSIRADMAQFKSAIQSQNAQDLQTQQHIAELNSLITRVSERVSTASSRLSLTSVKGSKEPPLIAVIAAADHSGRLEPDSQLVGALQAGSVRRGLAVNVDLQTPAFVARNLLALLAGDGKSLRKFKAKRGRKCDYAVVLQLTRAIMQNGFEDTKSFIVTADSRLYTMDGDLLSLRTFSQTGAGFTDAQARDAAIARLGDSVGEFLDYSIQH